MSTKNPFESKALRRTVIGAVCGALIGGGLVVAAPLALDAATDSVLDKVDSRIDRAVDRSIDKADDKVDQYSAKIKETAKDAGDEVIGKANKMVDKSAKKVKDAVREGASDAAGNAMEAYSAKTSGIEDKVRRAAEEGGTAAIKKAASDGTIDAAAERAIKSVASDGIVIDGLDEVAYDLESLRKLGLGANKIVMAFNQLRAKYGQHFENKTLDAYYKAKSWYEDQGLDITADSLTGDAKKTYKALKKLAKEECPELYKKLCR